MSGKLDNDIGGSEIFGGLGSDLDLKERGFLR